MLSKLKTALRALLRRSRAESELDEELRYHIEQQIEQNIRMGMNPEEARDAAQKAFGGVEQAKERSRDARGVRWFEDICQDLRYGVRMLMKNPGFTLIAVLTLALGIGANTAVFSVINAVSLRPLPFPHPERLAMVMAAITKTGATGHAHSYLNFADYRSRNTVFEALTAYSDYDATLIEGEAPERVSGMVVSADFFRALGVNMRLGRAFTANDEQPGAESVIIGYGLWQRRLGANPNVVGRRIMLDGKPLALLIGAGLLIKSFQRLRHTSPGFDPQRVLTATVSLPEAPYANDAQQIEFFRRAIERISNIPGVEAVGAIFGLPYSGDSISASFSIEGQPDPGPGKRPRAGARMITPDYIRTMGIPLIKGRLFNDQDGFDAPKVMLINETLARRFFPGQDPIGKRLKQALKGITGEIVGVVGDVRDRALSKEAPPEFYLPYTYMMAGSMSITARVKTGDPMNIAAPLRAEVREIDKDLP
ncbi:MAG TPA: ABC transporter permease, partial [Blastocatellia bacterium]